MYQKTLLYTAKPISYIFISAGGVYVDVDSTTHLEQRLGKASYGKYTAKRLGAAVAAVIANISF